jgi:hypothetical protein
MYDFSCPACLTHQFSSRSLCLSPPPATTTSITAGPHKIVQSPTLRLARALRCRCGHLLGDWILSNAADDNCLDGGSPTSDAWQVTGVWTAAADGRPLPQTGDLLALAARNEETRRAVGVKAARLAIVAEGLAVQLVEVAKRYLAKFAAGGAATMLNGLATVQIVEALAEKIAEQIEVLRKEETEKILGVKKSVKNNEIN